MTIYARRIVETDSQRSQRSDGFRTQVLQWFQASLVAPTYPERVFRIENRLDFIMDDDVRDVKKLPHFKMFIISSEIVKIWMTSYSNRFEGEIDRSAVRKADVKFWSVCA